MKFFCLFHKAERITKKQQFESRLATRKMAWTEVVDLTSPEHEFGRNAHQ